jgi:uncharacterized membrane protein
MYKPTVVHYIAKALVNLMFYGGIVCVVSLPWMSKYIVQYFGCGERDCNFMTAILIASGLCTVYILYNLKLMYKTLLGGNPFVEKNISCFRKMAVSCALISLIYLIKCFVMYSIATVVLVLMFAVGTLFCLTLKDIFKQAMFYKEEHDWTV